MGLRDCKKGLHAYKDFTKQVHSFSHGTLIIPDSKKCVYCGKVKALKPTPQ